MLQSLAGVWEFQISKCAQQSAVDEGFADCNRGVHVKCVGFHVLCTASVRACFADSFARQLTVQPDAGATEAETETETETEIDSELALRKSLQRPSYLTAFRPVNEGKAWITLVRLERSKLTPARRSERPEKSDRSWITIIHL